ncbi:VIT1/CCC1 transporter family protein [Brachybacterium timonense]|uniref:VIT1/CCC1 transporter family protein n=1 Tax=Brachybacterium timonense TaxID=2050896 RepID=UPI000D0AF437|nr:VIT family protein [Brachybacterium timonense]
MNAPSPSSTPVADAPEPDGAAERTTGYQQRLNQLRAAVLGANDGIVSTAAVVVGVAGATAAVGPILTAGLAATVGGAVSMALGEYVSVSSQSDAEHSAIATAKKELADDEDGAFEELVKRWEGHGLSSDTARSVATEMHRRDPLAARLEIDGEVDPDDVPSPWHAAIASFLAFLAGAILPMAAILLPPAGVRIPITYAATLVALALTGWIAAKVGGANPVRAAVRVVVGGALALTVTFVIGMLLGNAGVAT